MIRMGLLALCGAWFYFNMDIVRADESPTVIYFNGEFNSKGTTSENAMFAQLVKELGSLGDYVSRVSKSVLQYAGGDDVIKNVTDADVVKAAEAKVHMVRIVDFLVYMESFGILRELAANPLMPHFYAAAADDLDAFRSDNSSGYFGITAIGRKQAMMSESVLREEARKGDKDATLKLDTLISVAEIAASGWYTVRIPYDQTVTALLLAQANFVFRHKGKFGDATYANMSSHLEEMYVAYNGAAQLSKSQLDRISSYKTSFMAKDTYALRERGALQTFARVISEEFFR